MPIAAPMALSRWPQQRDPIRCDFIAAFSARTARCSIRIFRCACTCGGLAEQSEVRVSGPLHRDHYRGGPVFFSAGSATQLATRHLQSFQEPPFVRYQRMFELSAEVGLNPGHATTDTDIR